MREILFRGKRTEDGKWVEGHYHFANWYLPPSMKIVDRTHHILQIGRGDADKIDPDTLGQFTGLTDKNSKKIFEGDIIKIPDDYDEFGINAGEVYEVYFAFGGFRLKPKRLNAKGFWLEDDKTVEIIGNIHDNPELLENP